MGWGRRGHNAKASENCVQTIDGVLTLVAPCTNAQSPTGVDILLQVAIVSKTNYLVLDELVITTLLHKGNFRNLQWQE